MTLTVITGYDLVSLFSILPSKLNVKCYNYGFWFWIIEEKMETSSGSRIHLKSSDCETSAILFLFSALEFWLPTQGIYRCELEVLENDAFTRSGQIFKWPVQNLFVQLLITWKGEVSFLLTKSHSVNMTTDRIEGKAFKIYSSLRSFWQTDSFLVIEWQIFSSHVGAIMCPIQIGLRRIMKYYFILLSFHRFGFLDIFE